MSEDQMHIAAVFETLAAAQAAQAALVAAGVPTSSTLVLDRGATGSSPPAKAKLWGWLQARLLPERHTHHYAEAITRGHPLLLADIDPAQRDAAVAALQTQHPIDLQSRVNEWHAEGWSGTYEGESFWEEADEGRPEGSDGIVGGDLIAGDYGAVGAPVGGSWVNTDILRGSVRLYRPA